MKVIPKGKDVELKWIFYDVETGMPFDFSRALVSVCIYSCNYKEELDFSIDGNTITANIHACRMPMDVYSMVCTYRSRNSVKQSTVRIHNAFQISRHAFGATNELVFTSQAIPLFESKIATIEYVTDEIYNKLYTNDELDKRGVYVVDKGEGVVGVYLYKYPMSSGADIDLSGITRRINELEQIIGEKQDKLVSGTNIKTINGQSILGEGNIVIEGGGGNTDDLVTGIKGNAESEYRKGNVNITPENIGLGNVDNTKDADKTVKHAVSADSAGLAGADAAGNIITATYATKEELSQTNSELSQVKTDASTANTTSSEAKDVAEQAARDAEIAKNAVATLEGLADTTTAQETLAAQVVQIEQNKSDILANKQDADEKLSELGSKEEHLEKKMSGVLWNAQAKDNGILFTSEDVRVGDSIILETDQLYAGGGVAFVDINGSDIVVMSFDKYTLRETVITENFSFAKVIWGGNFKSLKITNKDAASPLLRRLLDFKGSEMMGEYTETVTHNSGNSGALGNNIRRGDLVYIVPSDTSKDSTILISTDQYGNIGQIIEANKWTVASIDASYIRDNEGLNYTFTIKIKRRNSDILNYIDKLFDISESEWLAPTQLQPDLYYDKDGLLVSYAGFCVSTDIELSKGDLIVSILASDKGMSSIVKKADGAITPVALGKSYKHELYYWTADEDCAVRFSYSRNAQGQNYKIIKSPITNDLDSLKDTMKNVPIMVDSIGKNLFNPAEIIDGFYISTVGGGLDSNATSAVSGIIPVSPGDEYYIYRPINIGTAVIRCLDAEGTPLKPLVLVNGEFVEDADWEPPTKSIAIKIPDGAIGLQFTCKFVGKECGYDSTQVELGTSFTGYEPYIKRKIISNDNLPELTNTEFINIANSDKIGFFSNSFLNGYCMLGKHAINNLSMFSDYIMYNFGHGGDNALECLNRINNNETWLGDIPVQNWGIKYGVIAMQDNDGGLYNANSDTYYYNFKKLANAVKSMGGIPILGTEHDSNYYYYNLARLSREEGYMFMNWGKTASKLYNSVFKPFWYNSHPATRTAWMWTYGMKPYIDSLPRPQKSIKLFRVRPSIDTSDLMNLIYDDLPSRAARYEELTCGVSGLTESTERYFDKIDSGNTSYTTYKDEYQTLQARNSVNFGQYALVEVVSPYDCNNLNKIIAMIQGSGITNVYIKKNNSLDSPLPSDEKVAFGITSGTLSVGQEFQVTGGVFNNNILGTYIVEGIINGVVITTTSSSGKTTSGTDNPTTNISGVVLKGSYTYPSSEYMNRYHKPLGEWVSVDYSEEIDLSKYIKNCMEFDKMSLLLEGNNILISDIKFEIEGSGFYKENHPINRVTEERKGIALLTKSTFNSDDTEWSGISGVETYTPVKSTVNEEYEPLPLGIDTVRQLKEGQKVSQVLLSNNIDETDSFNVMLQIRIIARYFPEYINNDSKWATSRIKRGSYDCEKLSIMIGNSESDTNPTKVASINVGLWWNEFIIDVPYFKGDTLMIVAEGDDIQLAKCDVVQVLKGL